MGDLVLSTNPLISLTLLDADVCIVGDFITSYQNEMSLHDIRCSVYRLCCYLCYPHISFKSMKRIIEVMLCLNAHIHPFSTTNRSTVIRLVYRILVTYVRKIEDLRQSMLNVFLLIT